MSVPLDIIQNPGATRQSVQQAANTAKRYVNPQVAQIDDQIATLEVRRANASPREQANIGRAIDGLIQERAKTLQGGYAMNPFGKRDVADGLSKEQSEFVNDFAEMLESVDAGARGGDMIPDFEGGYKRTTDHSQFYRDVFAEKGRPPTKQEWFEHARKQLESGKDGISTSSARTATVRVKPASTSTKPISKPSRAFFPNCESEV
jgi:hypothetical protein